MSDHLSGAERLPFGDGSRSRGRTIVGRTRQDRGVYVGRPSPFANPYPITGLRDRELSVAQFRA